jgi:CHAD domain-containing protein
MAPPGLHGFLLRSLKGQWRDYRKGFKRCQKKLSEKSVHRFRVESRRLLSTIGILEAVTPGQSLKAARRALKKRLRMFAPLRDVHVQLMAVEELERIHPELAVFRRTLTKRERRLIKHIRKKFKRTGLRKVARRVTGILGDLHSLLDDQGLEKMNLRAVGEELGEAYRMVEARLRAVDPSVPATIHRTRVAFKKFRYMTEALRPLLSGVSDPMMERMQDYQRRMGDVQDVVVLRGSLEKFFRKRKQRPDGGIIRAKLGRRRAARIASFMKGADELHGFAPAELLPASRELGRVER